ncbi:hypothetical protein RMAECT_0593 [Rickettsia rhipicephali str. Ect]|uniref:Uncharacterized protein n=1 Tax=Rickettsia rhipicephali str. Ect TaxID=1359199 RepID=A0A0F3PCS5_RICRH|nr:hypothetical protein RMAECT_0593 [Rickettsia rhipicephali str. Ect]
MSRTNEQNVVRFSSSLQGGIARVDTELSLRAALGCVAIS